VWKVAEQWTADRLASIDSLGLYCEVIADGWNGEETRIIPGFSGSLDSFSRLYFSLTRTSQRTHPITRHMTVRVNIYWYVTAPLIGRSCEENQALKLYRNVAMLSVEQLCAFVG
jgi:hypothetical protein